MINSMMVNFAIFTCVPDFELIELGLEAVYLVLSDWPVNSCNTETLVLFSSASVVLRAQCLS